MVEVFESDLREEGRRSSKLYGRQVSFSFDRKRIEAVLETDNIYDKQIKNRVRDIVLEQRRKYKYLFATYS